MQLGIERRQNTVSQNYKQWLRQTLTTGVMDERTNVLQIL